MTKTTFAAVALAAALSVGAGHGLAQPSARRLRVTEDFRIDGAKQNYGGDLFGFLIATPTGRMAIADLYDFKVHIFEPNGKPLATFGAKGAGPGEFQAVTGPQGQRAAISGGTVGDTIWILDGVTRRVSYFTSEGKFLRTVVPAALMPPAPPSQPSDTPMLVGFAARALLADGRMLGWGSIGTIESVKRPDGTLMPRAHTIRSDIVLMSQDGKSHRSLAERPQGQLTIPITFQGGRTDNFPVPFAPRPLEAIAPDGNRFAFITQKSTGSTGSFTLTVISANGDTLVNRTFPFTGIPVTRAAADSHFVELKHDLTIANVPGMRPVMDAAEADNLEKKLRAAMPSVKSPLYEFHLGLDNTVWIQFANTPAGSPWLVLDPRGNPIGESVVKSGYMRQATRDYLWQLEGRGDETDIVRYKIGA